MLMALCLQISLVPIQFSLAQEPAPKPKSKSPAKEDQSDAKTMPKTMPQGRADPFFNQNDPPNLRELSEKDVMNVLELVRKEEMKSYFKEKMDALFYLRMIKVAHIWNGMGFFDEEQAQDYGKEKG